MKFFIALILLSLNLQFAKAQKQGNIWMGGGNGGINFNSDTTVSFFRPDNSIFGRTSASICDTNGNLLFYTNGFRIFNSSYSVIQNGDSLNIGDYISFNYGYMVTPDGAVIIPVPGETTKYYLFYMDLNFINTELGLAFFPTHLFYSLIDNSLDGGSGGIVAGMKDISIINDTLAQFGMQAMKHGNGRDWWLICHEYGTNAYYTFLIDVFGIHGPMVQKIGIRYQLFNAGIASIMKFSQDGSRFLHVTLDSNMVELFDFNRCTGLLSNYSMFKIDSNFVYADGASFSPNKKYIYVSTGFDMIRQYDIEANDITGSQIIIGTDDGIPDPFYAKYYLHQLGPDEKIYVTSYDQSYSLHVINSPNTAGLGCDFVQRGFHLLDGTSWFSGAPNIPNYSLGSSSGSDCDTLTSVLFMQPTVFSYSIYPNPCYYSSQLSISGATEKAEIFLYNTFGQLLYKTTAFPNNNFIHTQLPVRDIVAGIYLVKVSMGKKEIAQKLVKR